MGAWHAEHFTHSAFVNCMVLIQLSNEGFPCIGMLFESNTRSINDFIPGLMLSRSIKAMLSKFLGRCRACTILELVQ